MEKSFVKNDTQFIGMVAICLDEMDDYGNLIEAEYPYDDMEPRTTWEQNHFGHYVRTLPYYG